MFSLSAPALATLCARPGGGVSEMTVRRDLAGGATQLACLGGYVFRAEASGSAPRYAIDAENVRGAPSVAMGVPSRNTPE